MNLNGRPDNLPRESVHNCVLGALRGVISEILIYHRDTEFAEIGDICHSQNFFSRSCLRALRGETSEFFFVSRSVIEFSDLLDDVALLLLGQLGIDREAPKTRVRQLRHLGNLRSGIQDHQSNPVGAAEPDNRLRFPRPFHAGIAAVDLDLETEPQIDCKYVPPSPPAAKRILTAPSLRITIDTGWHYCGAFQSIW